MNKKQKDLKDIEVTRNYWKKHVTGELIRRINTGMLSTGVVKQSMKF